MMFNKMKTIGNCSMMSRFGSFAALLAAIALSVLFTAAPAPAQIAPGYALYFDGVDDAVTVPDQDLLTFANAFTWEAWVNITKTSWPYYEEWATLFSKDGFSSEAWFSIFSNGVADVRFNDQSFRTPSSNAIALQTWQHVAVTWDGSNVCYFFNGQLDRVVPHTNITVNTSNILVIGRDAMNGRYHFNGMMDELRLWNVRRSQADIQSTMHCALTGSETGLVAYWTFDEGFGRTVRNRATASGSACDGTFVSFPPRVPSPAAWLPALRLYGANPLTNECHAAYVEPGAVAYASPTDIGGGEIHSLALKADGTVVAWGYNNSGQLNIPPSATNVIVISVGEYHNLALKADGTVVAWGYMTTVPASATNIVGIAAGGFHSLALKADGTVVAWGNNINGQTTVPSTATNVVAIAAGEYHSLALKADRTVVAWGNNNNGQTSVPATATNVIAIAAGNFHSMALSADGTVICWGWNNDGQTNVPASATNVVQVSAGWRNSLALKADGSVVGWGYNEFGQSDGATAGSNNVAIASGGSHSVALKADGTVVAWGDDYGGQTTVPASAYNLALPVSISGTVDTNVPGTYVLTYHVTNSIGNVNTTTRTVLVVDTTAPLVTLLGSNPIVLAAGAPFVDPGATASDICAGDLTGSIVVTGAVNVHVIGSYTLTYSATDSDGNTGAASRAVWVTDVPSVSGLSASFVATNPITGIREAALNASINPNGRATTAIFQYGLSAAYPGASVPVDLPASFSNSNLVTFLDGLMSGYTYHWRVVASNNLGVTVSPDQLLAVPTIYARGDFNGNGIVEQSELDSVYSGYWQDNPTVITNAQGMGKPEVKLAVDNMIGWDLTAQYSDDLMTWSNLSVRAVPVFQFADPDATNHPTRTYRLLAP